MSTEKPSISYGTIWVYLMILVALGVASLKLPHGIGVIAIFSVASVKAFLVLRHYMHVHGVPKMIYALIAIPLALAFLLIFAITQDIALDTRKAPAPHPAVEVHE